MSQFLNIMWYLTSGLLIIVILIQNPKAEGAGLTIRYV
nr:SecG [Erythrotrichia longistipitata]